MSIEMHEKYISGKLGKEFILVVNVNEHEIITGLHMSYIPYNLNRDRLKRKLRNRKKTKRAINRLKKLH